MKPPVDWTSRCSLGMRTYPSSTGTVHHSESKDLTSDRLQRLMKALEKTGERGYVALRCGPPHGALSIYECDKGRAKPNKRCSLDVEALGLALDRVGLGRELGAQSAHRRAINAIVGRSEAGSPRYAPSDLEVARADLDRTRALKTKRQGVEAQWEMQSKAYAVHKAEAKVRQAHRAELVAAQGGLFDLED